MADAKNMKEYHGQIQEALDDKFLRATLDKFAVEYKANRVRNLGRCEHGNGPGGIPRGRFFFFP